MTDWTAGLGTLLRRAADRWRDGRAMAAVESFGRRLGRDPDAALAKLDADAKGGRGHARLRAAWSMRACAWIDRWTADHPIAARRLLDDLAEAATAHPQESPLMSYWAMGALSFVSVRAAADPIGCVSIFAAMEPYLLADSTPFAVRRLWAMAVQRWIIALARSDPAASAAGLGPMADLALQAPPDLGLVTLWRDTVLELATTSEVLTDPDRRPPVLDQAAALSAAFSRYGTTVAGLAALQMLIKEDVRL